MNIAEYFGINLNIALVSILILAVIVLILFIFTIINIVQMKKLKKNYKIFMTGKNAVNLESTLVKRLDQVDELLEANEANEKNIEAIFQNMKSTFQKVGLVKYDAFNEMGGKLSFSLVLLNETNDGFVMNAMHSREGCYTYIKEIVAGNSIIVLADEEKEALEMAIGSNIVRGK